MRNILLLLIFLTLHNGLIAQEQLIQNQWFDNGQKYLKKGQIEIAISQFHMANKYSEDSNIKILASQKIDSLLPIIQNKNKKQWQGNWKLKELHFDPYPGIFTNYIRFENDTVVFYYKNSEGKEVISRSELIRFRPYHSTRFFFRTNEIVFENTEIWSFYVTGKKKQKRLYPTIERDSTGTSTILLDERGMIINKKTRKKEMKKEIYTFYVIAK